MKGTHAPVHFIIPFPCNTHTIKSNNWILWKREREEKGEGVGDKIGVVMEDLGEIIRGDVGWI